MASLYADFTLGNEGNAGSLASPLKYAVGMGSSSSGKTLSAGDFMLQKRGEKWREQLTVPSSGSTGSPITFGAYGGGDGPIISGANDIIGSSGDWADQGGNVWRKNIGSTEPLIVVFDDTHIGTNDATPDTIYEWTYSDPNLDVYSEGNPTGVYTSVEAGQRDYAILIDSQDYIILDGLDARHGNIDGIGVTTGSVAPIIQNCNASYNKERGIWVSSGTDQNNGLIYNCETSYNGEMGILLNDHADGWTISTNEVHHNGWSPDESWTGGIKSWSNKSAYLQGNIYEYNHVYSNASPAQTDGHGTGIWIDEVYATSGHENIIRFNSVHDNDGYGILLEKTDYTKVYYNIVYGNAAVSYNAGIGVKVWDGEHSNSNKVYNNVVYANKGWNLYVGTNSDAGSLVNDNEFKNNIIYGVVLAWDNKRELWAPNGGANDGVYGSGNVYSYNCLGAEYSNYIYWDDGFVSTYDAWETAYGGSTYSVEADPLLTDPANGNFNLQNTSPCINAGTPVGLLVDYDGKAIIGNPDIGAYENHVADGSIRFMMMRIG